MNEDKSSKPQPDYSHLPGVGVPGALSESKRTSAKFCLIYFIIVLILIIAVIVNFFFTKGAFEKNKYVLLPPEKLCNKNLNIFSECLQSKMSYDKCIYENKAVEDCYDEANALNRVCYIYLSELDLCLRNLKKNANPKNFCHKQLNEVIECGSLFKYLQLDKEKLLDNLFH